MKRFLLLFCAFLTTQLLFGQSYQLLSWGHNSYGEIGDNPLSEANYYRLKINDLDGQTAFSKIVSVVQKGKTHPLSIFPNPAEKTLTIQFNATGQDPFQRNPFGSVLTLSDMLGKIVLSKKVDLLRGQPIDT